MVSEIDLVQLRKEVSSRDTSARGKSLSSANLSLALMQREGASLNQVGALLSVLNTYFAPNEQVTMYSKDDGVYSIHIVGQLLGNPASHLLLQGDCGSPPKGHIEVGIFSNFQWQEAQNNAEYYLRQKDPLWRKLLKFHQGSNLMGIYGHWGTYAFYLDEGSIPYWDHFIERRSKSKIVEADSLHSYATKIAETMRQAFYAST